MEINMNGNRFLIGTLSALTMFVASTAVAVEQEPSQQREMQMKKKMDGNMSCEGMMGEGMMGGGMMGGMMKNGPMMPSLPPGNEN
jgi:hypothetical protein